MAVILRFWTRKKTAVQLIESATARDPELARRWSAAWPPHRKSIVAYVALAWDSEERGRRVADVLRRISDHEVSGDWLDDEAAYPNQGAGGGPAF